MMALSPKERKEAAAERDRIARSLGKDLSGSRHIVKQFGEALLWLEDRDAQVTVAWVSTLGLRRFLQQLEADNEEVPLVVSRISHSAPKVSPRDLLDPDQLSDSQTDGIYLVRAEMPNAVIVWERTGDRHSDVAVAAETWEAAEQYLANFVSPDEQTFVSKSVEDFRALSA